MTATRTPLSPLGGARMGARIGLTFLLSGAAVIVIEVDNAAAAPASGRIADSLTKAATRGRSTNRRRPEDGFTPSAKRRSPCPTPPVSRLRAWAWRSRWKPCACSKAGVASADDIDLAMTLGYKHPWDPCVPPTSSVSTSG
jgi:3-hydroxyacyl-CoA dehydrogenase